VWFELHPQTPPWCEQHPRFSSASASASCDGAALEVGIIMNDSTAKNTADTIVLIVSFSVGALSANR
jgi:hypothetical protein